MQRKTPEQAPREVPWTQFSEKCMLDFSLDEGSGGLIEDRAGQRHLGTLNSGVSWAAAPRGRACQFDGVSGLITTTAQEGYGVVPRVSVCTWIYLDILPSASNIFYVVTKKHSVSPFFSWALMINNTNDRVQFRATSSGGSVKTSTASIDITANSWHFIVGTYDGTTVLAYDNGVVSAFPQALSGNLYDSNQAVLLGASTTSFGQMQGRLVRPRVWLDRVLTPDEIATLANF